MTILTGNIWKLFEKHNIKSIPRYHFKNIPDVSLVHEIEIAFKQLNKQGTN